MNKIISRLPALFLTLVVGVMASSTAFGQATIVIENFDAAGTGFNDSTPATPVGGNSGTTIGQQRLNAFQHAANIWGATLPGGPTITVRASWEDLPCEANSATLGSAGSIGLVRNFANAPVATPGLARHWRTLSPGMTSIPPIRKSGHALIRRLALQAVWRIRCGITVLPTSQAPVGSTW